MISSASASFGWVRIWRMRRMSKADDVIGSGHQTRQFRVVGFLERHRRLPDFTQKCRAALRGNPAAGFRHQWQIPPEVIAVGQFVGKFAQGQNGGAAEVSRDGDLMPRANSGGDAYRLGRSRAGAGVGGERKRRFIGLKITSVA